MVEFFTTTCKDEVKTKLAQISTMAYIFASFHVTRQKSNYNVIFGQDFQNNFVSWKETKIPIKSIDYKIITNFSIQDSKNNISVINCIKKK